MARFFAVDTRNDNKVTYFGSIDSSTGEWLDCNEELLGKVRQSMHERLTTRTNEILNADPTVPFVLVDDPDACSG